MFWANPSEVASQKRDQTNQLMANDALFTNRWWVLGGSRPLVTGPTLLYPGTRAVIHLRGENDQVNITIEENWSTKLPIQVWPRTKWDDEGATSRKMGEVEWPLLCDMLRRTRPRHYRAICDCDGETWWGIMSVYVPSWTSKNQRFYESMCLHINAGHMYIYRIYIYIYIGIDKDMDMIYAYRERERDR